MFRDKITQRNPSPCSTPYKDGRMSATAPGTATLLGGEVQFQANKMTNGRLHFWGLFVMEKQITLQEAAISGSSGSNG